MKKLILLISVICISNKSLAQESSYGVHPIEISHICKGFKECGIRSHMNKKKILSPKFVSAIAETQDMDGKLFTYIAVDSYHKIMIKNETSDTIRYTYHYRIECLLGEDDRTFQVDLKPNQFINDDLERFATLYLEVEGKFPITASTSILGRESISDKNVSTLTIS